MYVQSWMDFHEEYPRCLPPWNTRKVRTPILAEAIWFRFWIDVWIEIHQTHPMWLVYWPLLKFRRVSCRNFFGCKNCSDEAVNSNRCDAIASEVISWTDCLHHIFLIDKVAVLFRQSSDQKALVHAPLLPEMQDNFVIAVGFSFSFRELRN